MEIIHGVYQIRNLVNNKVYIGSSWGEGGIFERWATHKRTLFLGKHENNYLQRAYNKYGKDNFEFSILELCPPKDAYKLESYYLLFTNCLDPVFGYNTNPNTNKPPKIYKIVSLINPKGELITHLGVLSFCKKYDLKLSAITNLLNCKRHSYKGWINPNNTFIQSDLKEARLRSNITLDKHYNKVCKEYPITFPNGKIGVIRRIQKYARENKLDSSVLIKISKGIGHTYKGYLPIPELRKKNKGFKECSFINPQGILIKIINLLKFCRDNGLCYTSMKQLDSGYRKVSGIKTEVKSYKGWTKPSS